jgi:putative endonuclease
MVNHHYLDGSAHSTESNDPEPVEGPSNGTWKMYIAQSVKTLRYYTGISPDPEKRLTLHNSGAGAKFAVDQGPLKLVYVSNAFPDKSSARIREVQVKGWRAEKKKWLIDGLLE